MSTWNAKNIIWNCLSILWNKQFLIFLFFFLLSSAFWLFEVLNETTEHEFEVPIEVRGIPSGVIITSEIPSTARVVLRDKGVNLLGYEYGGHRLSLVVDWANVANPSGHVRILPGDLRTRLASQLSPGTQVVSLRPDTFDFYYNYGLRKRVPVRLKGNIQAEPGYEITMTELLPDSVTVYASNQMLERITVAYVKPHYLNNITDSTTLQLDIEPIRGVKFVPGRVSLRISVDRLVEKRVKVPIHSIGFPAGKELLPIPQEIEVAFYVPMSLYRSITADDFSVAVRYSDLPADGSTRCPVIVDRAPEGVTRVRLIPGEVEYVIEELH